MGSEAKGCRSNSLPTYADLTLAKAVEVAQSMEAAERDTQEMKTTELTVRKVSTQRGAVKRSRATAVVKRSRTALLWVQRSHLSQLSEERPLS